MDSANIRFEYLPDFLQTKQVKEASAFALIIQNPFAYNMIEEG